MKHVKKMLVIMRNETAGTFNLKLKTKKYWIGIIICISKVLLVKIENKDIEQRQCLCAE